MELSLVIPVYNEEENLRPLYNEIRQVMDENFGDYEVIFVDDGSTDSSLEVLNSIQQKDPNVKILEFEGNFGQTEAIQAGLDYAVGKIIVTIDSDMQNDPKDIPRLVDELERSGSDMVNGWRNQRQDPFFKKKFFPRQLRVSEEFSLGHNFMIMAVL